MRTILSLLLLLFIISCSSQLQLQTVKFKYNKTESNCYVKVPKGFYQELIACGGTNNNDFEHQYYYADSSIFYAGSSINSFDNWKNIAPIKEKLLEAAIQEALSKATSKADSFNIPIDPISESILRSWHPDSINMRLRDIEYYDSGEVYSGVDSLGLHWCDVEIGNFNIGYIRVPDSKKPIFDSALKTIVIKRIK